MNGNRDPQPAAGGKLSRQEALRIRLESLAGERGLESLALPSAFDPGLESVGLDEVQAQEAKLLRKLRSGRLLSGSELERLEDIVQRELEVAVLIAGGRFKDLPHRWRHFNSGAIRDRLHGVIPSVGRVEVVSRRSRRATHVGTGFIVGDRLLMMARHMADTFAHGAGREPLAFMPGRQPVFNLGGEKDDSANSPDSFLGIIKVLMVHPYWDMALFEMEAMPAGVQPIRLSVLPPEELMRREIAIVSYPGRGADRSARGEERNQRLLQGIYGVKRLSPGIITGWGTTASFKRDVSALIYESATSEGSAGAPVIDVSTGHAVALHIRRSSSSQLYGVPAYDLARDPRVVDAGVLFSGHIPPAKEWGSWWRDPEPDVIEGKPTAAAVSRNAATVEAPPSPDVPEAGGPMPYPEGQIAGRLARLQDEAGGAGILDDRIQSFRQAAAVLAAFDPATLRNVHGGALLDSKAAGTALKLDMMPSPYQESEDDPPWSLAPGPRRRALRGLQNARDLQAALAANAGGLPDLPIQRMLSRAILMTPPFEPDQMDITELSQLATVSDWLDGTEPGERLPHPADLLLLVESRRDRALLHRLASGQFTGRQAELALLREHLESVTAEVLFISGQGGLGKSALISQALLEWKGQTRQDTAAETVPTDASARMWARIDMDHSLVQPESPLSVLLHAARQINRTHPELQSLLSGFIETSTMRQNRTDKGWTETQTGSDSETESQFIQILRFALPDPRQRLVFWLDTFEEAQFLGVTVADQLLGLAARLTRTLPQVRVVVSGRAPPPAAEREKRARDHQTDALTGQGQASAPPLRVLRVAEPPLRVLLLGNLEESAAVSLLTRLLEKQESPGGAAPLPPKLVHEAAAMLGGHPLTLRLAARELQQKGPAALADLAGLREDVRQKQLLSRIATHLHEASLEKLLLPGMEVRVITPDVVRHVLAGPCGLGSLPPEEAWTLFDHLKREITLVEPETEGPHMLRYRQDIRLVMLAGQEKLTAQARRIHENAVNWWRDPQRRKGQEASPLPRAEELYHRLRLGHSTAELESLWEPEAGRLLRSTLDELPPSSEQRLWLAGKLKVVLADAADDTISQAAWEHQTATQAQQLLRAGQAQEALAALTRRADRLPGSALYGLESRALLLSGQDQAALQTAMDGIAASRLDFQPAAVELALLAGFIQERLGHLTAAREAVDEAVGLAAATGDSMLVLSAGLRARRLERLAFEQEHAALPEHGNRPRLPPVSADLDQSIRAVSEYDLRARPDVLRELAAEHGVSATEPPVFLRLASETQLEELLTALPLSALLDLMDRLGVLDANEKSSFSEHTSQQELVRLARGRIMERLHLPPNRALIPFYETLRGLCRQAVTEALHRDYQVSAKAAGSAAVHAPDSIHAHARAHANVPLSFEGGEPPPVQHAVEEARSVLAGLLTGLPEAALQEIARYLLDDDYARLSQSRSKHQAAEAMFDRAAQFQRLPGLVDHLRRMITDSSQAELLDRVERILASVEMEENEEIQEMG